MYDILFKIKIYKHHGDLKMRVFRWIPVLLLLASWSLAQTMPQEPADLSADEIHFAEVDGKQVVIGKGNVHVTYQGTIVRCDEAEFRRAENLVFAKGNVVVRTLQYEVRGHEGYYDFVNNIGEVKQGAAALLPHGWKGELYAEGDEAKLYPETIILTKGRFTTCDRVLDGKTPHYSVHAPRILIYPGRRVGAFHPTFRLGKIPVLYSPYARKSLEETHMRLSVGYRDLLGNYGTWIYKTKVEWAEDTLVKYRVDLMERQGVGLGVEVESKWDHFQGGLGSAEVYYATGGKSYKGLYEDESRWFVEGELLERATEELIMVGKANLYSDRDVKKHFFWKEYREDPSIESYASMTWLKERFSAYGLVDVNLRSFETDVERLPQVGFDWKRSSLGDTGIYLDFGTQFADLKNGIRPELDDRDGLAAEVTAAASEMETMRSSQQDVDLVRSDRRVIRVDQTVELSRPFRVGDFLGLEPAVEYQGTYYSDLYDRGILEEEGLTESKTQGSDFRNAITGKLQAKTSLHRIHERSWVPEARKVRHQIEPSLGYRIRPEPTIDASELIQFDKIDALQETNSILFELINRWEKKNIKDETSLVARVDVGAIQEMASGQRDFLTLESWIRIWDWWSFYTDTRYDTNASELARVNTDLAVLPMDQLRLTFGTRYYPRTTGNDNLDLSGSLFLKVTEGLKFGSKGIYDVHDGDLEEIEISFHKSLHCWDSVLAYSKRRERDEQQVAIYLCIKAIPTVGFSMSGGFD